MENTQSYLGIGWGFPPAFDRLAKQTLMVSQEQEIAESLEILLSTRPGERVMQPGFGCNLDILLFEPLTTMLLTRVRDLIRRAILFYEARIEVLEITLDDSEINRGRILIGIQYAVRSTNSRFNFVYPFYLNEGNTTVSIP